MKTIVFIMLSLLSVQSFGQGWEQLGPMGGYVKEITFHPTNPAIIYAGSDDGGGVWKSENGGADWRLLTGNFPNMTGWSITINEANPSVVYACDVYGRYGLLKSTDGGTTWHIANGLSSAYDKMVSGIALKSADTLFISTGEGATTVPPRPGNGVFRSDDGGASWRPAGLQDTTVLAIGNNVFGTLFAGTEGHGLQFSNSNGQHWAPHPQINAAATVFEIEVADNVIAVAANSGVYLSTNWGVDFVNTGLAGDFNFDVAIRQTAPTIELVGTTFSGLQYYSSATGTWNLIADPLLNNELIIGIGAADSTVMVGTFSNSPLVVSHDGGSSWSQPATSPVCTEINDVVVNPNDAGHMLVALLGTYNVGGSYNNQCLYETTDAGSSWSRKGPKAHAMCLSPNPANFNSQFLGTFSQGLYKSSDRFGTFTNLISGNKLIADVAISARDTNIVLISEVDLDAIQLTIKRSTDAGSSFSTVAQATANRLLFHPLNNDTAYAATDNGILLSADVGATWSPWVLNGNNISAMHFAGGALFAGTNVGQLYKIEDGLVADISGNWEVPVEIKSIHQEGKNLLVGLNGAEQDTSNTLNGSIWRSFDRGTSWHDITAGMT
ncbi:MAG: hypothetical protein AAGB22_03935, partial [Bacteroidota bacterium]